MSDLNPWELQGCIVYAEHMTNLGDSYVCKTLNEAGWNVLFNLSREKKSSFGG